MLLYGAGAKGAQTTEILKDFGVNPMAFIDSYSKKREFLGKPVVRLEKAKESYAGCCILISMAYTNALTVLPLLMDWDGMVRVCANPFKVENHLLDFHDVKNNGEQISDNLKLLSDEKSRQIFRDTINWKLTGDSMYTGQYAEPFSDLRVFAFDQIDYERIRNYVDVGAYTGDTIVRYLAASRMKYDNIIAIEPDSNGMKEMRRNLSSLELERNIQYITKGVYESEGELTFYSTMNAAYESANFSRDTGQILSNERKTHEETNRTVVAVDTLDHMCSDYDDLLIKIDAQGSEYEALKGCCETIRKKKPVLILELATCSKHIWDIIPMIYEMNNRYRFYIRQTWAPNYSRPVLYAL